MRLLSREEKLSNQFKPKRILSLDGGGIRGAISLMYLKRIESMLRIRHNSDTLVLADYFDLIGGTSTGAIIAAGLSIGMSVDNLIDYYKKLGPEIFNSKRRWINPFDWKELWKGFRYDERPLIKRLKEVFGDITLGDQHNFKTNLCIVTKRIDTYSTWLLNNNPHGKYFKHNKHILLADAVRASTAAPAYFEPQIINVKKRDLNNQTILLDHYAAFIDGGASLHNNPSFQLLLLATLQDYHYKWSYGVDNLLLVSVGTGSSKKFIKTEEVKQKKIWFWGKEIPNTFMEDAQYFNQMLLQFLSISATAQPINREVGDLISDKLAGDKHLTYLRYNIKLEENELRAIGYSKTDEEHLISLREMSNGFNCKALLTIGSLASHKIDYDSHFENKFNL